MLINATEGVESRVAILDDGVLDGLHIEFLGRAKLKGNIYRGTVVQVEPSLQAAFVEYGGDRHGFLSLSEVNFNLFKPKKGRRRIEEILHRGTPVLVQVIRDPRGQKGAALSTFVSLAGRYLVYMPKCEGGGISRKIEGEERTKLKAFFDALEKEEGELPGLIIRTAGVGRTSDELKRDYEYLKGLWTRIEEVRDQGDKPGLIYQELDLVMRTVRDYFSPDIDEILVDDEAVAEQIRDFLRRTAPEAVQRVKVHHEKRPIFSRYQTEEQIATIYKRQVPLPSGGSIVIDPTEALVAIDVNSGKANQSKNPETTSLNSNLEAAVEIARQLRMRDLGGLVVCDFIDMREAKNRHKVEETLKAAMKGDKARFDVGKISPKFGLLELSRQRVKASLLEGSHEMCPVCDGVGRVQSTASAATGFLRGLQATAANPDVATVHLTVTPAVAGYILNEHREALIELERLRGVEIHVDADPLLLSHQSRTEITKVEKESSQPVQEVATALDVVIPETTTTKSAKGVPSDDKGGGGAEETKAPVDAAEEGAGNGRKRRRRRRRRGGRGRGAAKAAAAAAAAAEATPEGGTSTAEAGSTTGEAVVEQPTEPGTEAMATPAESGTTEAPKKRRRRRRRRRSGSNAVAAESAAEPTAEPVEVAAPAPAPVEMVAETTPNPEGDEMPAEPPAEAPPKKRRATRKKAAAKPATDDGETAAEPPPKKKRATRKKAAAKPATDGGETTAEEPPKKKRATRNKAAAKPATDGGETTAEEPPKKKRATRKKAAAKPATNGGETAAEEPPKKKRATRKKAAAKPATDGGEAAAEAPPKKKRATRKKAAAKPATDGGETAAEPPPKKKRATRKKTAAKPATDGGETAAEPPPKKRRATRKKVAAKVAAPEAKESPEG